MVLTETKEFGVVGLILLGCVFFYTIFFTKFRSVITKFMSGGGKKRRLIIKKRR